MDKYKLDKSAQIVENSNYIMTQEEVCERLNQQAQRIAELEEQLKNKQEEVVKSLQEYLTEHDKQLVDKIKRHFDNNFYFDISGQMCVSMEELDEFLGQLKGENK